MTTKQRAFLETCTDEEVNEACNWIIQLRELLKSLAELVQAMKPTEPKQPFKIILDETYFKENK
jgi:hypothetical protein